MLNAAEVGAPELNLTAAERQWIATHPVIHVAHLGNSGPFCFLDNHGDLAGMNFDYLAAIAERTGLRFEHRAFPVWSEAFDELRAGKIDLVMGIGRMPQRERFLTFTRPYAYSPDAIVTRNDTPFLFDLRSLGGHRVAISRSSTELESQLRARAPDVIIVPCDNMTEAVYAVARGRAFAAVTDATIAAFVAKRDALTQLRLAGMMNDSADIYAAARSDWPELAGIIDKALGAIPAAERTQINNRWVVLDYSADRKWRTAFQVAAVVAGLALVVFLIGLFYSRRLTVELRERRRIQEELEAIHERLTEVDEEKSELMHMLAHDLRNPLTAVLMGSDLLKLGCTAEEQEEIISRMNNQVRQMMRLIEDLMDANAIKEGRRNYKSTRTDVAAAVRASVEGFAETTALKNIRLHADVPPAPLEVETDEGAFRQIVDNLISNAVKFSPVGESVTVTLSGSDNRVRVAVTDGGPGLTADEISRLFTKYGKGRASATGGEKKIGLGLWIVKRLVAVLEGRVWCESVPGHGATFIVELPVQPVRAATAA